MNRNQKLTLSSIIVVALILLIDQSLKLWIKTHLMLGEEITITNWFRLHFTENEGMAFGTVLPGPYAKIMLSSFRIVAVGLLIYYIRQLILSRAHFGYVIAMSLILAGAAGNIFDSAFYGLFYTDSSNAVAHLVSCGKGYAAFMTGSVVDMLWFPICHGVFPKWVPFWGGQYFEFFRFIFNIADASITCGVALIILFQRQFFTDESPVVNS